MLKVLFAGGKEELERFLTIVEPLVDGSGINLAAFIPQDKLSGKSYKDIPVYSSLPHLLQEDTVDACVCSSFSFEGFSALEAAVKGMSLFFYPFERMESSEYASLFNTFDVKDLAKKRQAIDFNVTSIADSKLVVMKNLIQSGRLGKIKSVNVLAQSRAERVTSIDFLKKIFPLLFFIANVKNKTGFKLDLVQSSAYKDEKERFLIESNLSLKGIEKVKTDIVYGKKESAKLILHAERGELLYDYDGSLHVEHENGVKEHYSYSEDNFSLESKLLFNFFAYMKKKSGFLYSPFEDSYPLFQIKKHFENILSSPMCFARSSHDLMDEELLDAVFTSDKAASELDFGLSSDNIMKSDGLDIVI